jgi:hypothetical protein
MVVMANARVRRAAVVVVLVLAGGLWAVPARATDVPTTTVVHCTVRGSGKYYTDTPPFSSPQPFIGLTGTGTCTDSDGHVAPVTLSASGPGACSTSWSRLYTSVGPLPAAAGLFPGRDLFLVNETTTAAKGSGVVVGQTADVAYDFKGIPYAGRRSGKFVFQGTGCKPTPPLFELAFAFTTSDVGGVSENLAACEFSGTMGSTPPVFDSWSGITVNFTIQGSGECSDAKQYPVNGVVKVRVNCAVSPPVKWLTDARVGAGTGNYFWRAEQPAGTAKTEWSGTAHAWEYDGYGSYHAANETIGAFSITTTPLAVANKCRPAPQPDELRPVPVTILYAGEV